MNRIKTKKEKEKEQSKSTDYSQMLYKELVEGCDMLEIKCPHCEHKDVCFKIAENHVGRPYQYTNNDFMKNRTINDLLTPRAV